MKQPVHLWILFGLCLLLILPAMVWLTAKAIELDRDLKEDRHQTELARREAELQEKITSALYRMDWKLGPHIAREAARPFYLYESFYDLPSPVGSAATAATPAGFRMLPSPLLYQNSEFVQLHFQITPAGVFSSPQRPNGEEACRQALFCCGVTDQSIELRDAQLDQVRRFCSYDQLLKKIQSSTLFDWETTDELGQNVYVQPQIENYLARQGEQILENEVLAPAADAERLESKSSLQRLRVADRGDKEFIKRQESYNTNTIEWADNNRGLGNQLLVPQLQENRQVVEGVMRPIWIGDELILTRRTRIDSRHVLQCCWLDWEKIQNALRHEVNDILPDVRFEPVVDDRKLIPGRALVTLPAQVVVDVPKMLATLSLTAEQPAGRSISGMQVALWLAWIALALSTLAIGLLLYGVIRLSERRAAFVSAVTHELRTPLTTFRMYSEMLADKMVPVEKQSAYAHTLRIQADRLSHLVENVLQFARLERTAGNERLEHIRISDLIARFGDRLAERAAQAGMTIEYAIDEDVANQLVRVEQPVIEQIIFNLVDNACKYANKPEKPVIVIGITDTGKTTRFTVRDFGPGIEATYRKRLFQPFCKSDLEAANSAPGVGLGLALCQRMARSLGGTLTYHATHPGACFQLDLPMRFR